MYVYVVSYVIFIQRKIDNVLNFNPSKFQLKRNKSSIFIAFSVLPIFVYWIFLDIINRGKSAEKNRGKKIGGKIASRVKRHIETRPFVARHFVAFYPTGDPPPNSSRWFYGTIF